MLFLKKTRKRRWPIRKFRKKFKGITRKEEKFRVNNQIISEEVRVVSVTGDMLGVMPIHQALSMAENGGLDLVEIAPKAKPPTCKIMDYGKWKFQLSKKEKISRKNQVKIIIKEIQLRPRTDTHDLEIKIKKAKEFLLNGCKVKIHLRYSGREMAHKELGLKTLDKVKEALLPYSVLEKSTPQMEKRSAFLFFAPDPVKFKELQKKKKHALMSHHPRSKTNYKKTSSSVANDKVPVIKTTPKPEGAEEEEEEDRMSHQTSKVSAGDAKKADSIPETLSAGGSKKDSIEKKM